MNIERYLSLAGVPTNLHTQAVYTLTQARERIRGLTWAKAKVRVLRAGQIADMIPWEAERLIDVRPDLAEWDIGPAINITAHGDNAPWVMTPDGGRPLPGRWMDRDPASAEYQQAVASNYWCPGKHPRSRDSRKAWYRRNACEYSAWQRGVACNPKQGVDVWERDGVKVLRCGDAWQLIATRPLLGPLKLSIRVGYEIDNIWVESSGEQAWYPIEGHELRAPVTWFVFPTISLG